MTEREILYQQPTYHNLDNLNTKENDLLYKGPYHICLHKIRNRIHI